MPRRSCGYGHGTVVDVVVVEEPAIVVVVVVDVLLVVVDVLLVVVDVVEVVVAAHAVVLVAVGAVVAGAVVAVVTFGADVCVISSGDVTGLAGETVALGVAGTVAATTVEVVAVVVVAFGASVVDVVLVLVGTGSSEAGVSRVPGPIGLDVCTAKIRHDPLASGDVTQPIATPMQTTNKMTATVTAVRRRAISIRDRTGKFLLRSVVCRSDWRRPFESRFDSTTCSTTFHALWRTDGNIRGNN